MNALEIATNPALRSRAGVLVNDLHSKLNATRVRSVFRPGSREELACFVRRCAAERRPLSIAGGRGAMGGQAFRHGEALIDTRSLDRVLGFDPDRRRVRVEAGIQWRPLMAATAALAERFGGTPLAIAQKQTGADALTLGGSLAANAHGRGLTLAPLADQVEAISIIDASGQTIRASRHEDPELFALALGGYGLFGIVSAVELDLVPRRKLRRRVEVIETDGLMDAFGRRIEQGFLYGDFQPTVAADEPDFLRRGVFACYEPVDSGTPGGAPRHLGASDWRELLHMTHVDPARAFERYAAHYLATDGQVYWSDTHQLAEYSPDYHTEIDERTGTSCPGSEMITELYVPRARFASFLDDLRCELRERRARLVYSTVRLIERDTTSFLAWAREPWACTVLNLHVDHDEPGRAKAKSDFRALNDIALAHGGSFYLTYHPWATADQLRAAYPQIPDFLRRKRERDPEERFQSDWYARMRGLLDSE